MYFTATLILEILFKSGENIWLISIGSSEMLNSRILLFINYLGLASFGFTRNVFWKGRDIPSPCGPRHLQDAGDCRSSGRLSVSPLVMIPISFNRKRNSWCPCLRLSFAPIAAQQLGNPFYVIIAVANSADFKSVLRHRFFCISNRLWCLKLLKDEDECSCVNLGIPTAFILN